MFRFDLGGMTTLIARAVTALDEMVGVISLVGQQGFGLHKCQQRVGLRDVMDLPTREAER